MYIHFCDLNNVNYNSVSLREKYILSFLRPVFFVEIERTGSTYSLFDSIYFLIANYCIIQPPAKFFLFFLKFNMAEIERTDSINLFGSINLFDSILLDCKFCELLHHPTHDQLRSALYCRVFTKTY